jgi:hypothetical protein
MAASTESLTASAVRLMAGGEHAVVGRVVTW